MRYIPTVLRPCSSTVLAHLTKIVGTPPLRETNVFKSMPNTGGDTGGGFESYNQVSLLLGLLLLYAYLGSKYIAPFHP